MTSIHRRRLDVAKAHTAERIIDEAQRNRWGVEDLRNVRLPWYRMANQAGEGDEPASILIYEEIGGSFGVDPEQFARDLAEITAPVITVRINSPGGSLFDGVAIYNSLNHHRARKVVYVDSLAASIASVIAMAGDEIVMMPGAQMMIHDAAMLEDGNAADMAKAATFLDRQSDNVADIYRRRAGGEVAQWRALMLAETWMFASEAVEMGLADRVEETEARDPTPRELASRSFDLGRFRYAGRAKAPAPQRLGAVNPPKPLQVRGRSLAVPPAVSTTLQESATARAAAGVQGRAIGDQAPAGASRSVAFPATKLRAQLVDRDGRKMYRLDGYASVVERAYEMWDDYGPYQEVVDARAFDKTLAAKPDVAFLVNHRGVTMARTTNGTLQLSADSVGLRAVAFLNPDRQDVRDLVSAIDDELITEMSFAFMLEDGEWSKDLTEYRIKCANLHRGDASAVNYGANPYTSIAARSREIMAELGRLPAGAARAALDVLHKREDLAAVTVAAVAPETPAPAGRSVALVRQLMRL